MRIRRQVVYRFHARVSIPGVTLVRDEDETIAAGTLGAREALYLLRPDRYVAGTFPMAEVPRIPALIEQWLAAAA